MSQPFQDLGWRPKRESPNLRLPVQSKPPSATEFEMQIAKLGLTKEGCIASRELRNWCERNKNRCYVPEWLLKAWAIAVEPNLSE
jgi:hypothetical protein